jgi:hypothetical protein
LNTEVQCIVKTSFLARCYRRLSMARQPCRKIARRIEQAALRVRSHGAVYFYHRRRGLLTR